MYKTILVPVDMSHEERVGPMMETAKLLGGQGSKVVLVHVVEEIPAYVAAQIPSGVLEDTRETAEKGLKSVAEKAGIDADIVVQAGHAANTILDIAEERNVDCIVIASHKPGWEDFLIGSTAARVVRHAKCAVHVLR